MEGGLQNGSELGAGSALVVPPAAEGLGLGAAQTSLSRRSSLELRSASVPQASVRTPQEEAAATDAKAQELGSPIPANVMAAMNAPGRATSFASVSAVDFSSLAEARSLIAHAEARAEESEMEIVRLRASLADSLAQRNDTAKLFERLRTENTRLRQQLDHSRAEIAELTHLREECQLKHGGLLAQLEAATAGGASTVEDAGAVVRALEQAKRHHAAELAAVQAKRQDLERRLEAAEALLQKSPGEVAAELAQPPKEQGGVLAMPSSLWNSQNLSKRGEGADVAWVKLKTAEVESLRYQVEQLETELLQEKRRCAEYRTNADRQALRQRLRAADEAEREERRQREVALQEQAVQGKLSNMEWAVRGFAAERFGVQEEHRLQHEECLVLRGRLEARDEEGLRERTELREELRQCESDRSVLRKICDGRSSLVRMEPSARDNSGGDSSGVVFQLRRDKELLEGRLLEWERHSSSGKAALEETRCELAETKLHRDTISQKIVELRTVSSQRLAEEVAEAQKLREALQAETAEKAVLAEQLQRMQSALAQMKAQAESKVSALASDLAEAKVDAERHRSVSQANAEALSQKAKEAHSFKAEAVASAAAFKEAQEEKMKQQGERNEMEQHLAEARAWELRAAWEAARAAGASSRSAVGSPKAVLGRRSSVASAALLGAGDPGSQRLEVVASAAQQAAEAMRRAGSVGGTDRAEKEPDLKEVVRSLGNACGQLRTVEGEVEALAQELRLEKKMQLEAARGAVDDVIITGASPASSPSRHYASNPYTTVDVDSMGVLCTSNKKIRQAFELLARGEAQLVERSRVPELLSAAYGFEPGPAELGLFATALSSDGGGDNPSALGFAWGELEAACDHIRSMLGEVPRLGAATS
mmetsp:Transcript_129997/g.290237  ORF Transcript_129997/g.290237 Transcript_129997/m.290237 type:complete len:881 (-) Transcript_129997:130-2772(-)